MAKVKAVIFDLDDTLYDERQFVEGGFKAVSLHIENQQGICRDVVYAKLLDVLNKHGRGYIFDIALQQLDLFDKFLISELIDVYRMHNQEIALFPETKTILAALKKKGYLLGLITDGNVQVQRNKVRLLEIRDFFDCMVFSDEYGLDKRKPSPFPYQKALNDLALRPDESLYVGDNPHKDFISAKKMGMQTVRIMKGIYKGVRLEQDYEASIQIETLSDLWEILGEKDKR